MFSVSSDASVSYEGLPLVEVSIADDLKPEPVVITSHKLNLPLPVAEKLINDIALVIAQAISMPAGTDSTCKSID